MARVGIVMPYYNQIDHLEDALRSIAAQTYRDFHFLLFVDGLVGGEEEKKRIVEICKRVEVDMPDGEIRWMMLDRNSGSANAISMGHRIVLDLDSDVEFMTWVSSDNEMHREWLESMVNALDSHRMDADFIYSSYTRDRGRMVDGQWIIDDSRPFRQDPYNPRALISTENCFMGPAFLYRRSLWEKTGDHRGKISHDYDWWLRAEEACNFKGAHLDMPHLCKYRVHKERVTVVRRHEYDAKHWQQEAIKRRGS